MLKKSMRQLLGLDLPVVPRSYVLLPSGEGSIEWDDTTARMEIVLAAHLT